MIETSFWSILGRRCHYRKVDGFTTTYAISAYHHLSCEFEPRSWRGVLDTTFCDKVFSDLRHVGVISYIHKTI
jgi:hypothetical protein